MEGNGIVCTTGMTTAQVKLTKQNKTKQKKKKKRKKKRVAMSP